MDVPLIHTDGCGMMIPTVNDKNMMVRAPWIKGLLASFDFRKFILKANAENPTINHGIVFDIYGKRHDVLAEDIEVIFTKSQFKMWKYYDSWEDYISKYERYGCSIGKCNEEEEYFKDTKLNYQMLQTLSDMTDWELGEIAQRSSEKIRKIAKDRKTMLRVFGVNEREINQTYLQQALALYPELLGDVYTKDVLMQIKKKLVREARAGKLDVNGKYTFIIPDLYAFCEYLFMKNERPVGIIGCGEVYCSLFKRYNKLDCLRSPHLYREHAVRQNIYNDVNCKEWFTTNALYISSHDLISRVLQCDFDGDRSLVCADKLIVSIAERNMNDVVPLYYKMRKAENMHVDSKKIFEGLIAAYTGGSIGQKSNDITKICDSDGKPVNWDAVKYLCMETNFVIDYAKTLYKPIRPKNIDKIIKAHTKNKVPYFFIYAKDKTKEQVSKKNNSLVNRLEHFVPNQRLIFKSDQSEKFDYRNLM
jgi:arsenate reductase-like glutaredoxin family protein